MAITVGIDTGKKSRGIAVYNDEVPEFEQVDSYVFDDDYANPARPRRHRHYVRHSESRHLCKDALFAFLLNVCGLDRSVLEDPRITASNDPNDPDSVPCVARIRILQGEVGDLEDWHIVRALISVTKRRGPDLDVPWKTAPRKQEEEDQERAQTAKSVGAYRRQMKQLAEIDPSFRHPAYLLGSLGQFWDPETDTFHAAGKHDRQSMQNQIHGIAVPREAVIDETRALLEALVPRYPALGGRIEEILFGVTERPYGTLFPSSREGTGLREKDHSGGILGQRTPRFENRGMNHCSLIPKLNAARADAPEVIEAGFVMQALNLRFLDADGNEQRLSADEIGALVEERRLQIAEADPRPKRKLTQKEADLYSINKTTWKAYLRDRHPGCQPCDQQVGAPVDKPSFEGRSKLCRPAAALLVALVLSGKKPSEFHRFAAASPEMIRGLDVADLDFLLRMSDNWGKIHIPACFEHDPALKGLSPQQKAMKIAGRENDPVLRNRLTTMVNDLEKILERHPDAVFVVEATRELKESQKQKRERLEYQDWQRKRRENRKKLAAAFGISGSGQLKKLALWEQQGGVAEKQGKRWQQTSKAIDFYTGLELDIDKIPELEIEHVVPKSWNGSGHNYNLVLTTSHVNQNLKKDQTPLGFLGPGEFKEFQKWVLACKATLGREKTEYLLDPHPEDLDEKMDALAGTGRFAVVVRQCIAALLGISLNSAEACRRIRCVRGIDTAAVRRANGLDKLIVDGETSEKIREALGDSMAKHGLDAMAIALCPSRSTHPEFYREHLLTPEQADAVRRGTEKMMAMLYRRKKARLEEFYYRRIGVPDGFHGAGIPVSGEERPEVMIKRYPVEHAGGRVPPKTWTVEKMLRNVAKVIDLGLRRRLTEALFKCVRPELGAAGIESVNELLLADNPPDDRDLNKWIAGLDPETAAEIDAACKRPSETKRGEEKDAPARIRQRWISWCAGQPVRKVAVTAQTKDPDKYVDVSRDGFGAQWQKSTCNNGALICRSGKKVKAIAVPAFKRRSDAEREAVAADMEILEFLQTNDIVSISKKVGNLSPGVYRVQKISGSKEGDSGQIVLVDGLGRTEKAASPGTFVKAGLALRSAP